MITKTSLSFIGIYNVYLYSIITTIDIKDIHNKSYVNCRIFSTFRYIIISIKSAIATLNNKMFVSSRVDLIAFCCFIKC